MIERDDFDRRIVAWLADEAGDGAANYLGAALEGVRRTRQRPAWANLPSSRPVERTLRRLDIAPALWILVLLGLLLATVVVTGFVGGTPLRLGPLLATPTPNPPPPTLPSESPPTWPEAGRAAQVEFRGRDFYAIPYPLASGGSGALVYVQRIADHVNGRVYRVLYHSRSVSDRDVGVSGTIWIPESSPPAGGYRIVSFAMGNDGSGDKCAMSRNDVGSINASYGDLMSLLLGDGYVVAYTDYEGLGTSDPYPFAVLESAAHNMLDAARAARDLLGSAASNRIVLFGESSPGGDAAATAGELAADYAPDLDIRGVIGADGGGGDHEAALREFIAADTLTASPNATGLIQAIAGYSIAFPELHPEDVLTPLGLEDMSHVDTTCWTEFAGIVSGQSAADVLAIDPLDVPAWARRIRAMTVTEAPYPTLLLATGTLEPGATDLRAAAARFCRGNDAVLFRDYPTALVGARDVGGDPYRGVYVVSWPDTGPWIADRFAGVAATGNCREQLR
jgi:hypothetical protein